MRGRAEPVALAALAVDVLALVLTAYALLWPPRPQVPDDGNGRPTLAWRIRPADVPPMPNAPTLRSMLSFELINYGPSQSGACFSFPGAFPYSGRIRPGGSHDPVQYELEPGHRMWAENMRPGNLPMDPIAGGDVVLGCGTLQRGAVIRGTLWYLRELGESTLRTPRTRTDTEVDSWQLTQNRGKAREERPATAFAVDRVVCAAVVSVFNLWVGGVFIYLGGRWRP